MTYKVTGDFTKMKSEEIKNEAGEVLTTKDGEQLIDYTFEVGDEFIPQHNAIITSKKGDAKFPRHVLLCKVRNKDGVVQKNDKGEEEIFIRLTESQMKTMQKKIDASREDRGNESLLISNNLFVAYEYESKEYGTQIGVGYKPVKAEKKSFGDFE